MSLQRIDSFLGLEVSDISVVNGRVRAGFKNLKSDRREEVHRVEFE